VVAASCLVIAPRTFPAAPAGEADSDRGKENREPVIDYEILLMLDPEVDEDRQSEIVLRIRQLVENGGGTWDNQDVWGRRRLAYEINKRSEGAYHLLTFSAEPETLDEISRVLKIDDNVMRHMATRRLEPSPGQPVAVGGPAREDAEIAHEPLEEEE
jgi:small subunit ribosomal protein S6